MLPLSLPGSATKAVAGLEGVAGEESGDGQGFFAFDLHAVEGEVAVAGGDGEEYHTSGSMTSRKSNFRKSRS